MSVVKEIREALDVRLDKLDARAEALEALFESGRDEAAKRIQQQKQNLAEAAGKLEKMAAESASLAVDASSDLHAGFDHLQVQLALGKAETREVFDEQAKKIRDAMERIEDQLEHVEADVEEELANQTAAFIRIANRLRAEIEAAELQFALFKADHRDDVEAGKKELRKKLSELRDDLRQASHEAGARFEKFESEFGEGLGHIRKAFLELTHKD